MFIYQKQSAAKLRNLQHYWMSKGSVITSLFFTHVGCYLGYETEHGNYEFRTFLNNDKKLKKLNETEVMQLCHIAHVGLNPSLYTKDILEKLKKDKDFHDIAEWFNYKLMP